MYSTLLHSLDAPGAGRLDALAGVAVLLGSHELTTMSARVCELTAERFQLQQQISVASAQHAALNGEEIRLEELLQELSGDDFQPPLGVLERTAESTRSTKHLKVKLVEYDERLSTLRSSATPSPALETISWHAVELGELRERLQGLGTELSAFDSLPSDPKAARAHLERSRADLRKLTIRRDQLFESLAD